jgi:hypothetical protein
MFHDQVEKSISYCHQAISQAEFCAVAMLFYVVQKKKTKQTLYDFENILPCKI